MGRRDPHAKAVFDAKLGTSYTVVGFNNPAGILHLGWEWVGLATCIAISSSICQSFLVWRLSKLVRVWWMLAPLVALILTCFIVTLYGGYQLSVYQTLDQRTCEIRVAYENRALKINTVRRSRSADHTMGSCRSCSRCSRKSRLPTPSIPIL